MRRFFTVLLIVIGLGNLMQAEASRGPAKFREVSEQFDVQKLEKTVPLWFLKQNIGTPHYQDCWKVVYSIIVHPLENNPQLAIHHTEHHTFNPKNKALMFGDIHDIRVQYTEDVFKIVIDYARKALIRRLAGGFCVEKFQSISRPELCRQEYLPFSLSFGSMEIPLSPYEEFSILNDARLVFWSRISEDPLHSIENWSRCRTRVKSIGIEIGSGIKSIYFATEGFFPLKSKPIEIKCSKTKMTSNTSSFAFPPEINSLNFSTIQGVINSFVGRPFYISMPLQLSNPVSLSECMISPLDKILKDIIYDPLAPDFSFKVVQLKENFLDLADATSIKALQCAKNILKLRIHEIFPRVALFSYKIALQEPEPYMITLSHVSLNNPAVNKFKEDCDMELGTEGVLENSVTFLEGFCESAETNADVFAIAALLAKSEKEVKKIFPE